MCPYCGDIVEDDVCEYRNDSSFHCSECGKDSDLNVDYTVHFTTTQREKK